VSEGEVVEGAKALQIFRLIGGTLILTNLRT
jgi:hypothetical protein